MVVQYNHIKPAMTSSPTIHSIDSVRASSRKLVRELGFMGGSFAGTNLPPSSVHALIEIGAGEKTARDLGALLHLEKSSVSRMLKKLVQTGDVKEETGQKDGRVKRLSLTEAGQERVTQIHSFARAQVTDALNRLKPGQDKTVLEGLKLYANALAEPAAEQSSSNAVDIVSGYEPGLIAHITEMHALYYARATGFGRRFESVIAGGLSKFTDRLDNDANQVWTAQLDGKTLGAIAIDGEDLGADIAHLRWFIVDNALRGTGSGKALLDTALAFADEKGFAETHLWTFSELHAARHLYDSRGFKLVEARAGTQWGNEVLEQRFVRPRPIS